jgi:hypothetical protein
VNTISSPLLYRHSSFAGLIGVARADITPPTGIYARNWGAAPHDVAAGIHRPLTATALSLQSAIDSKPLLLIALDLGWWRTPQDEYFVRGALLDALGLDSSRVMMNLSHTHAGPSLCREDADKPGGEFIAPYLETLKNALIGAARAAVENAAPGTLSWHYGRCELATNRDLPDPQQPRFVTGYNPAREADDTLLVGRVTGAGGVLRATLVNYACHPTVLAWQNELISPDYIGAMREVVEGATGAPCLFLQGASGELAPHQQYVGDVEVADRHGRQLGYAALSTLAAMLPPHTRLEYSGIVESGAPLAMWELQNDAPSSVCAARQIEVELPLKDWPAAAELAAQLQDCADRVLAERLRRKQRVRESVGDGATAKMPLWVWRVGDAILLGQPQEAYSWLQTHLRARFSERAVAVMNLVNGAIGYLPPADLYDEDLYTVWQTPFARGGLKALGAACEAAVEAALDDGAQDAA